jgi:hypothetical protein
MSNCNFNNRRIDITSLSFSEAHQIKMALIYYHFYCPISFSEEDTKFIKEMIFAINRAEELLLNQLKSQQS